MSHSLSRLSCCRSPAGRSPGRVTRLFGALGVLALVAGASVAIAQVPAPASPLTINVVDVAGDLALTQGAIEAYQQKNPKLVGKVNFTKAPAPELPAKLKAMQAAGRSDIDLVLTGVVALSAGIDQGLWVKVLPDHAPKFPSVLDNYLPAARKMQDLSQGEALVVTFMVVTLVWLLIALRFVNPTQLVSRVKEAPQPGL